MKREKVSLSSLDYEKAAEEVYSFIQRAVEEAHASGVVVGLSGGVDSSLTAVLCVNALGSDRVLGVSIPIDFTPNDDVEDARKLAEQLGVRTRFVNIQSVCNRLFEDLGLDPNDSGQKMARANVYARMRMIVLYFYANLYKYLVVGTSDKSEALIGFFTKYGDGGADLFPLIHLYKTQVRELARYLEVPEKISQKPSSPQLYPGHKVTDEIPIDYDRLDRVLVGLFDQKLQPIEVSRLTSVPVEVVEEISRRFNVSKHKRAFPPSINEL